MVKDMAEEKNYQIIRKDAKNCFVESLSDAFSIGKIHFNFATYDLSKPAGKRQTNNVSIYVSAAEFLELNRKLCCGELKYIMQTRKKSEDSTPLFQSIGGTSAKNLKAAGRERKDGKSLSRIMRLSVGKKSDFLLCAESGAGVEDEKGLIVPKFGDKPENRVVVSMAFDSFSELVLLTKSHYDAWLVSEYINNKPLEVKKGLKDEKSDINDKKMESYF